MTDEEIKELRELQEDMYLRSISNGQSPPAASLRRLIELERLANERPYHCGCGYVHRSSERCGGI